MHTRARVYPPFSPIVRSGDSHLFDVERDFAHGASDGPLHDAEEGVEAGVMGNEKSRRGRTIDADTLARRA